MSIYECMKNVVKSFTVLCSPLKQIKSWCRGHSWNNKNDAHSNLPLKWWTDQKRISIKYSSTVKRGSVWFEQWVVVCLSGHTRRLQGQSFTLPQEVWSSILRNKECTYLCHVIFGNTSLFPLIIQLYENLAHFKDAIIQKRNTTKGTKFCNVLKKILKSHSFSWNKLETTAIPSETCSLQMDTPLPHNIFSCDDKFPI